jgi:hypothetical protein
VISNKKFTYNGRVLETDELTNNGKYFAKQLVKVEISAENSSTDQRQTRGNPEDAKPWARTFYKRVARLHLIFRHRV